MPKTIAHVHWPDAPDLWMPYAPAIKVTGGTTVYLAGVTAAPVYHHHPHRPEEFDRMPADMAGQARAALENLKRGLDAVGASFADVVTANRFVTDLSDQDALNRVWAEYFRDAKPATTTVQVVRLATDPRCLVEQATAPDRAEPERPQLHLWLWGSHPSHYANSSGCASNNGNFLLATHRNLLLDTEGLVDRGAEKAAQHRFKPTNCGEIVRTK